MNDETQLTIEFDNPSNSFDVQTFPYSNNEIIEFGLTIEVDQILQRGCFEYSVRSNSFTSLDGSFCNINGSKSKAIEVFTELGLGQGDTLAYTVVEYVYPRKN